MSLRTFLLILVLAVAGIFVAVNWPLITAPATINFVFAEAEAPFSLILIVGTGLLVVLFLTCMVLQHSALMHIIKQQQKELDKQRELAMNAEASRFTELRTMIEALGTRIAPRDGQNPVQPR